MTRQIGQIYSVAKSQAVAAIAGSVSTDSAAMSASAIISTPAYDRQNDSVNPMGVDLTNYRNNPVVYFDHGQDITQPIAKAEDPNGRLMVFPETDIIKSTSYFTPNNQVSSQFFHLVNDGILRGTSIRFSPLMAPIVKGGRKRFNSTTLEEWSWTGLGVNPECVKKAIDKNRLDGTAIHASVMKSLRAMAPPVTPRGVKKSRTNQTTTFTGRLLPEILEKSMSRKVLGQEVMEAGFTAISNLESQLKSAMTQVENPVVNTALSSISQALYEQKGLMKGAYAEAYPKACSEAMKDDDSDEKMYQKMMDSDDYSDAKMYEKMAADSDYMKMYDDESMAKMADDPDFMKMEVGKYREKMMEDDDFKNGEIAKYREKMMADSDEKHMKSLLSVSDESVWKSSAIAMQLNDMSEQDDMPLKYRAKAASMAKSISALVIEAKTAAKPAGSAKQNEETAIEDTPQFKAMAKLVVGLETKLKSLMPCKK